MLGMMKPTPSLPSSGVDICHLPGMKVDRVVLWIYRRFASRRIGLKVKLVC